MDYIPFAVDLTSHAAKRMQQRRISETAVVIALVYGREVYTRGAYVCVIGHKEIEKGRREGMDLSAHAGIHVVVSADGAVLAAVRVLFREHAESLGFDFCFQNPPLGRPSACRPRLYRRTPTR